MKIKRTLSVLLFSLMPLAAPIAVFAGDPPFQIKWSAKDIGGGDVKVPADSPTVIAFIRSDQDQSKQALQQIQSAAKQARVIVILSGPTAQTAASDIAKDLPKTWSVVADPEFAASGQMDIHVWPTTLVAKADGTQVAHLAGM